MFKRKDKKEPKPLTPERQASEFIQSANAFEKSRVETSKKMAKIAWAVAGISCVCTALSIGAVMGLTPLKEVQPYLVRVDNNTGVTDLVTTLKTKEDTYGEVMDKYWLSQYVKYRESYNWYTVQSTYDASMLLSSPEIQADIGKFMASPAAPYKVFKDTTMVDIKILAVTWVGNTAQVRFERTIKKVNATDQDPPIKQRMIATIGYHYFNTPQKEADRLINPLGLQILSYRVDPEG